MAVFSNRYILLSFLLVSVAWLYYFSFIARAQVNLNIETEKTSWFKIYWAERGAEFSEANSSRIRISARHTSYQFYLTDIGKVERLRIDTHQHEGAVVLRSLTIQQKGYEPLILQSGTDFLSLQRGDQVKKRWVGKEGMHVVSSGEDPNFLFTPRIERVPADYSGDVLRVALLLCIVACCYFILLPLAVDLRFVPVGLTIVLFLVLTMAYVSRNNVHPDEYVHVAAVEYYSDSWLPPEILSDDILSSYSPYGASRLNSDEIYYLIAGKFAWLTNEMFSDKYRKTRLFGPFLLLCMILYTFHDIPSRAVALPFLVSPQIWYVFAYTNSDAFALFVIFIAGCQVANRDSLLNRYLCGNGGETYFLKVISVGLLLGVLLVVKHNYLAFLLLAILWYVIFSFSRIEYLERKDFWVRLVIICCLGTVLFGVKKSADYYVNGPERGALLDQAQARCSDARHDENGSVEEQEFTLHFKDKGVTVKEMIFTYLWPQKTFKSAFGVYGYFKYEAGNYLYTLFKWAVSCWCVFLAAVIVVRGPMDIRIIFSLFLLIASLLVAASLYHSWAGDFQPQGRYLFPLAGMFGMVLGLTRNTLPVRWVAFLTFVLFLLSCYSFIFIGLQNIPRVA